MKKRNLRKQTKLLVEHILDKDPISANSIFQKLILEAEEAREEEVAEELDLTDEPDDTAAEDGGDDLGLDEGGDDTGEDIEAGDEEMEESTR